MAMQVRLLPDALVSFEDCERSARSSIGSGRQPLTLEGRVQFPHGSLDHADQVVEWQTRDAQNVVPSMAWEFDSPLGH